MDVARSAPQGIKKGASALWYSELNLHQLGSGQQSFYPDGQHNLAFFIKCVPPVGLSDRFGPYH